MADKKTKFIETMKKSGKFSKPLLKALAGIDRAEYVDDVFHDKAWNPEPLLIGMGETSDDPLIMLRMIDLLELKKSSRVLEIGTGSGYSTSILASLAEEVITIEYHEELAAKSRKRLSRNGFRNIRHYCGDGTLFENLDGLGTFDAVIIFAASIMRPLNLLECLNPRCHAVFPMGTPAQQMITLFKNSRDGESPLDNMKFLDLCTFRSLRGCYGWIDNQDAPL